MGHLLDCGCCSYHLLFLAMLELMRMEAKNEKKNHFQLLSVLNLSFKIFWYQICDLSIWVNSLKIELRCIFANLHWPKFNKYTYSQRGED